MKICFNYCFAKCRQGFTLIELSVVLVIIGFITGGIFVGITLVKSSEIRATISQKEKFDSATAVFENKYGGLPGDLAEPTASQYGFKARGVYAGEGDGNGVMEGVFGNAAGLNYGNAESAGETVMFWVDLSKAGLIEGGFNAAFPASGSSVTLTPGAAPFLSSYFPLAKLNGGNYFYIYSIPLWGGARNSNYYGLSALTRITGGTTYSNPGLSVLQASDMDKKIDDGLPLSGQVVAYYIDYVLGWPAYPGPTGTAAYSGSASSCYDNNG